MKFIDFRKIVFDILKQGFNELSELKGFGSQYYSIDSFNLSNDIKTKELYIEILIAEVKKSSNINKWKQLIENIKEARHNAFKNFQNKFYKDGSFIEIEDDCTNESMSKDLNFTEKPLVYINRDFLYSEFEDVLKQNNGKNIYIVLTKAKYNDRADLFVDRVYYEQLKNKEVKTELVKFKNIEKTSLKSDLNKFTSYIQKQFIECFNCSCLEHFLETNTGTENIRKTVIISQPIQVAEWNIETENKILHYFENFLTVKSTLSFDYPVIVFFNFTMYCNDLPDIESFFCKCEQKKVKKLSDFPVIYPNEIDDFYNTEEGKQLELDAPICVDEPKDLHTVIKEFKKNLKKFN